MIHLNGGEVRFRKPVVYQEESTVDSQQLTVTAQDGQRTTDDGPPPGGSGPQGGPRATDSRQSTIGNQKFLDGRFILLADNRVGFEVAAYDRRRPLVIDPTLSYQTSLAGSDDDQGYGIAVDSSGNAYVTGDTYSSDFPTTASALQATFGGGDDDAFVTKLDATGAVVYSTYLGGSSDDQGYGIAVDSSGNAYVTGDTYSSDFPTTASAYQPALNGISDAFVTELNAAGNGLLYSTYLGGSKGDFGQGIAVDSSGNAYVTGYTYSSDFPTTAGAYDTSCGTDEECNSTADAFVTKIDTTKTGSASLTYSTYLGGSSYDFGWGIAVDSAGNAYVTGEADSSDFPTTASAYQPAFGGGSSDAFVAKLSATGGALLYSTYLGGSSNDYGYGIAVDSAGNAYVTGEADSSDFPTTASAYQPAFGGGSSDAFVTKIDTTKTGSASLIYSTYLGGSSDDYGYGIAVDSSGNAYVTGDTYASNFPTTASALQPTFGGGDDDAFVTKLNAAGSALIYSSYLGGSNDTWGYVIGVDSSGNAYLTGGTVPPDELADAFVAKLSGLALPVVTLSPISLNLGPVGVWLTSAPGTVTLTNVGDAALTITSIGVTGDFALAPTSACPSSGTVAAGASCNLDLTFTPTALGIRSGTLTIDDNAAGSPQTVTLSGTGMGPVVSLSSSSMSFSAQLLGTSSTTQTATLTNTGNASLTISRIMASGDFSQTNTCGTTVSAGANCTISVTFKPVAGGTRTGTISISDNAPDSPQSVALSGTGQDFTLTASSGSSTSATAAPGQSATYTLSVGGEGGLNQTVTFTCTGAPSEATCTVSPSAVIPGSSATNITVSVTTTAASVSAPRSRPLPPVPPLSPGLRGLLMLTLVLAAMAWAMGCRKQPSVSRWQSTMVPLASGLLLTLALAGCGGGGGGGGGTTHNPGTPAGTYTLTVTGTAGSGSATLSHSVTLTLTVS